jgi:hypothetical protein
MMHTLNRQPSNKRKRQPNKSTNPVGAVPSNPQKWSDLDLGKVGSASPHGENASLDRKRPGRK